MSSTSSIHFDTQTLDERSPTPSPVGRALMRSPRGSTPRTPPPLAVRMTARSPQASSTSTPRMWGALPPPAVHSRGSSTPTSSTRIIPVTLEERVRALLASGGPPTRGCHSLSPLAPDARRAPPDVPGPPRYLRSRRRATPVTRASRGAAETDHPARHERGAQRRVKSKRCSPRGRDAGVGSERAHRSSSRRRSTHHDRPSVLAPAYRPDELMHGHLSPGGVGEHGPRVPHLDAHQTSAAPPPPSWRRSTCRGSTGQGEGVGMEAGRGSRSPAPAHEPPPPRSHSRRVGGDDGVPSNTRPALSPRVALASAPLAAHVHHDNRCTVDVGQVGKELSRAGAGGSRRPSLPSTCLSGWGGSSTAPHARAPDPFHHKQVLAPGRLASAPSEDSGPLLRETPCASRLGCGRVDGPVVAVSECGVSEGVTDSLAPAVHVGPGTNAAPPAGQDPWEREVAHRALERYPPTALTTTQTEAKTSPTRNDMTAFMIVVKHMPGDREPATAAEQQLRDAYRASPCIVRVFIPTLQRARATVAHLKQELQRRLGVAAAHQDLRSEGVRLLDELPLDLLDPGMVVFADLSSAPAAGRERGLEMRQSEDDERGLRGGAPQHHAVAGRAGLTQGNVDSRRGSVRSRVSLFKRGLTKVDAAQTLTGEGRPSSDSPTAEAADTVRSHLQRLRDLIGVDVETATTMTTATTTATTNTETAAGSTRANVVLRRAPPPPPLPTALAGSATAPAHPSPLASASSSSLDSLSALVPGSPGVSARTSPPNSGTTHRVTGTTYGVIPSAAVAATTHPVLAAHGRPSTNALTGDRGRAGAVLASHDDSPFAAFHPILFGSAGGGSLPRHRQHSHSPRRPAEEVEEEGVCLSSTVRPFRLAREHRPRSPEPSTVPITTKNTTSRVAAGTAPRPRDLPNGKSEETKEDLTAFPDRPPMELVHYPLSCKSIDGRPSLRLRRADAVTVTAPVLHAASRERMRQALALESAREALAAASAAHREATRAADNGHNPTARRFSLDHLCGPDALTRRVDPMAFPVPDEGGVSASELSSRERSVVAGRGNSLAGGGEGGVQHGERSGISVVDSRVVRELLARV